MLFLLGLAVMIGGVGLIALIALRVFLQLFVLGLIIFIPVLLLIGVLMFMLPVLWQ